MGLPGRPVGPGQPLPEVPEGGELAVSGGSEVAAAEVWRSGRGPGDLAPHGAHSRAVLPGIRQHRHRSVPLEIARQWSMSSLIMGTVLCPSLVAKIVSGWVLLETKDIAHCVSNT